MAPVTGSWSCTGLSDRHCEEQLPKARPTAKKKRRREANWCAEAAFELEEFGTQKTPGPAAAGTPAPAKQQKLSRTLSLAERVKAGLDLRKARKSAGQLLPGSSPGSAQPAGADVRGSNDMLPATERSADSGACSSGSDSDSPGDNARVHEAEADAWAEVLAEERDPKPFQTQTLPSVEAPERGEAAFQRSPAELQQPEPQAGSIPKRISPSLMQRRSTRGIIDAEALNSPPRGAPQKGKQPAQQQDPACNLTHQGAAGQTPQQSVPDAVSKASAAQRTADVDPGKVEQMRQAANAIKARKAQGGLCTSARDNTLVCMLRVMHSGCFCIQGLPAHVALYWTESSLSHRCCKVTEGLNVELGHGYHRRNGCLSSSCQQRQQAWVCSQGPRCCD